MRSYHAVTKITLKKEKSSGGIDYSRAAFSFVSKLTPEQIATAEAMANTIKTNNNIDVDGSDYATAAPAAEDGFVNVPDGVVENLPFN